MTDHVQIHGFKADGRCGIYDIDIFQIAYDEICISIVNRIFTNPQHVQFFIPIREARGCCWKCNAASIGENEGKAENIIRLFMEHDAYAWASVRHLIFEHPKKSLTPGL